MSYSIYALSEDLLDEFSYQLQMSFSKHLSSIYKAL